MTIITLLTDYGIADSYVAEVKGAILKINPNITIIDISHDVGNYDISSGAFQLARAAPYFPDGTIHVGVVDPGVGGVRKSIIIKTRTMWFVGPDNGLLAPASNRLVIEKIWEITNMQLLPKKVSEVFDGRDVFGPTAALLSKGISPEVLGTPIGDIIRLQFKQPEVVGDTLLGDIIHIDGFGNAVSNITYDTLERAGIKEEMVFTFTHNDEEITLPYVRRFSAVEEGEYLLLVAGGGYLEVAMNQGNASKQLDLKRGQRIKLEKNLI